MDELKRFNNINNKLLLKGLHLIKIIDDSIVYSNGKYEYLCKLYNLSKVKNEFSSRTVYMMTNESRLQYYRDTVDNRFVVNEIVNINGRSNPLLKCFNIDDNIEFSIRASEFNRIVDIYNSRYCKARNFIDKSKLVHGSKYTYANTVFTGVKNKVIVTCSIHGDFKIIATNFLNGHGCSHCAYERNGWTLSKFKESCIRNNNGIGCFYVIELIDDNSFKVGITSRSVAKRYSRKIDIPYKYNIIHEIYSDPEKVFKTERELIRLLHKYRKTPSIQFNGSSEVFDINYIEIIDNIISNLQRPTEK